MGTRFSFVHEFDCDVATYWEIFWDDAFNADLYPKMKCSRKLTNQRDEGQTRVRDQEVTPERDVPGALKKFLPQGALRYVEHGIFTKPAGPLEVDVKVPALGERLQFKATYTVSEAGPGRCKREFGGDCTVKIPLIGGTAEKTIISSMRETYETAAQVHREWISRRKS